MNRNNFYYIKKLSPLAILLIICFSKIKSQDTLSYNFPQYQNSIQPTLIDPDISILSSCDDLYDFYLDVHLTNGYNKITSEVISTLYLEVDFEMGEQTIT